MLSLAYFLKKPVPAHFLAALTSPTLPAAQSSSNGGPFSSLQLVAIRPIHSIFSIIRLFCSPLDRLSDCFLSIIIASKPDSALSTEIYFHVSFRLGHWSVFAPS